MDERPALDSSRAGSFFGPASSSLFSPIVAVYIIFFWGPASSALHVPPVIAYTVTFWGPASSPPAFTDRFFFQPSLFCNKAFYDAKQP